ncbi:TolC family protein [Mucilaginibacter sp. X5P1]|uniref:TolC family protein n=1 Tax=Mucilaginibacter sp. X5P1 TaxID=2723088 RepID=UPI00161F70ED|nr:TolC family protein [Mucilaginibacter sp. X5P1]MBB6137410.1 outer membrane protein TolC [Mucilaginibacter sp. X5P1]
MRNTVFIMALLCTVAVNSYAQQAPLRDSTYNFSIQDCVNYAYQHQDSVVNAGLDVKSAEYRVKEITGQGLPQISGTASFQDYLKTPSILFPDFISAPIYSILNQQNVKNSSTGEVIPATPPGGTPAEQKVSLYQTYNSNLGLTLNQIIFDGSYLVGLKASRTYKELSQRMYTRSKIEANVNVTKAYYQVLVSNEQIKLLDANLKQLKQQFDETVQENKQGFVEKIDVDRISVQYNNLVTSRENTLRLLVLNLQLLKFQMGMPIQANLILKSKLEDIDLNNDVANDVSDTSFYHKRIEYDLAETSVKLNELDLQNKKSHYLPTLSAVGNTALTYQNNSFGQLFSTSYPATYIGLSLNVPIFSGGQRINQVRQSKITVLKSQNDLYNLKNALSLQANSARVSYINGLQTLNNQKQNQVLAEEVLKVAKIKYQQGVGSSIEVTQAQTSLDAADNQYIQGLYDALVSKVDLDKAYGRIQ